MMMLLRNHFKRTSYRYFLDEKKRAWGDDYGTQSYPTEINPTQPNLTQSNPTESNQSEYIPTQPNAKWGIIIGIKLPPSKKKIVVIISPTATIDGLKNIIINNSILPFT